MDREVKQTCRFLTVALVLCAPALCRAHVGAFILAKCTTQSSGMLALELTVDYNQHPVLKDRGAALAALRQVIQLASPSGPAALDTVVPGQISDPSVPDADLPFTYDPGEKDRPHQLVRLSYSWEPPGEELRFSVPAANPYDVLFWLAGDALPADEPVPWRILIAGDQTPPISIRKPQAQPVQMPPLWGRTIMGIGIIGILLSAVVLRSKRT
jgi:hypothetical protein